jgi:catechol-2,3-dioxygenase
MNQRQSPTLAASTVSSLPDYYTNVFGFAQQASELQDYYQQQQSLLMMQQQQQHQQQRSSSTPLTCFLEAQRRNL